MDDDYTPTSEELYRRIPHMGERQPLRPGQIRYRAFIDSPIWRKIRREVLESEDYVCRRCGGEACQVHHAANYAWGWIPPRSVWPKALWAVCRECHQDLHPDSERLDR